MRATFVVAAALGLMAVNIAAVAGNPLEGMVKYECQHMADGGSRLACSFGPAGLRFEWQQDPAKLSDQVRELSTYRADKLVANFFMAGGNNFEIRGPHLDENEYRSCGKIDGRRFQYHCTDRQEHD